MSDYKCKCGNTSDFFIEHNLSQCGLYCGECGKWIKWLNKDEERLFNHKHSLAEHDAKVRAEAIDRGYEKGRADAIREVMDLLHGYRAIDCERCPANKICEKDDYCELVITRFLDDSNENGDG